MRPHEVGAEGAHTCGVDLKEYGVRQVGLREAGVSESVSGATDAGEEFEDEAAG